MGWEVRAEAASQLLLGHVLQGQSSQEQGPEKEATRAGRSAPAHRLSGGAAAARSAFCSLTF